MLKNIKRREVAFVALSILLLLGLAAFLFYSINFAIDQVTKAAQYQSPATQQTIHFNLQEAKDLGILK